MHNKNYSKIKNTQKKAFIEVLKISKIPFREFKIKKFNEKNLADLFLLFIFETIILANLMGVDAFNQPAVEKVKILTKKNSYLKKFYRKIFLNDRKFYFQLF